MILHCNPAEITSLYLHKSLRCSHLCPPSILPSSLYTATRWRTLHRRLHYPGLPDSLLPILHTRHNCSPLWDRKTLCHTISLGAGRFAKVDCYPPGSHAVDLQPTKVRNHHHTEPNIELWQQDKVCLLGPSAHVPGNDFWSDDMGSCAM